MDKETQILIFVNEFCNRLAKADKNMRDMHSWYLFSDKRPGTIQERFDKDARNYVEYERIKKP